MASASWIPRSATPTASTKRPADIEDLRGPGGPRAAAPERRPCAGARGTRALARCYSSREAGCWRAPAGRNGGRPTGTCERVEDVPTKPARFFGSVEIDMVRPVKAFDTILNAVVMELQRNPAAKVKLTLEVEAEATEGFDESDIGVVRDNARQLKFKPESTSFA